MIPAPGETFDIYHPDLIMVGRREVTIGQESSADPTIYDGVDRVSILHITAIKDLPG